MPDPFDDATGSPAERARAYLHTNCVQCHQPGGPTPAAIDLRYTTSFSNTNTCEIVPLEGSLGIPGARIIDPGQSASSVLLNRMNHRDSSGMPPVGSNILDRDGVDLISDWITSLDGCRVGP